MTQAAKARNKSNSLEILRYSVNLISQGKHKFFTVTMPSKILAETCKVTTRIEDPKAGFQRELDTARAQAIADYIDSEIGTIPNSIVLSAQPAANFRVIGRGKTIEFTKTPGAFLILDGQHRVYGFAKAEKALRVPVVIYNGLSRREETRLFIDINTKQKPVPPNLLLDIKRLADIETEAEGTLRDIFDYFDKRSDSVMIGKMSASEAVRSKISRVTFNLAVKPLLPLFDARTSKEIYKILNAYLSAVSTELDKKFEVDLISKPVIFRAFLAVFRSIVQRVADKYDGQFTASNFQEIITPMFSGMPRSKLESAGTSWTALRDYLDKRLVSKISI